MLSPRKDNVCMINVDKKLDAWKNKLLDLGKRNRLLNYHDTKRANLQIQKPEFSELWGSFVLNENPLVFPYYDDFGSLFLNLSSNLSKSDWWNELWVNEIELDEIRYF